MCLVNFKITYLLNWKKMNDRPDSVITTSSIVSNSSGSEEEPPLPVPLLLSSLPSSTPTLYAMSGLYTNNSSKPHLVKTNSTPPSTHPTPPKEHGSSAQEDQLLFFSQDSASLQSTSKTFNHSVVKSKKTLPASASINGVSSSSFSHSSGVGVSGLPSSANCHRRQASTPVQLSLYNGAVGGGNSAVKKAAYHPGHRRSHSHGHHRFPSACTHHHHSNHRRTGSSVIETLQTFSCGSTEHCYERENSLALFLENLKKEQQSR
ncbi:unnamed protein product [Lepeophtheirus salmonis]|uniref:(salmon louse) hypothetical protein n=1 Tax=Lepeophtheirus salmonis TaxID=72036 RepID=A0A7R8CPI3_LEPSM|nr:unnamed protein product [Lepeophtheirus salmonis]CAF2886102.1 unnamed protein product [Lepeophtheirus salmonis]